MSQALSTSNIRPDKTLVCDVTDLRLVVERSNGRARFLVLHPPNHTSLQPQRLLASGTEADLASAMTAAERVLEDFGLPRLEWRVL